MSLTIWKYQLEVGDLKAIDMPRGATILSVGVQFGEVCVWALVDEDAGLEERWFYMRGTGHDCDGVKDKTFLGTVQLRGGALIFHIFYE